MGLDMYLLKRSKESKEDKDLVEVAYWRKSNQIRKFFATNFSVDNCELVPVDEPRLLLLRHLCRLVLEHHELAETFLPTSSGFFFGSTEYDEWYFEDLEETVAMLSEVIDNTDWGKEDVYYYEWW